MQHNNLDNNQNTRIRWDYGKRKEREEEAETGFSNCIKLGGEIPRENENGKQKTISKNSILILKLPCVFVMVGYLYRAYVSISSALSCGVSATWGQMKEELDDVAGMNYGLISKRNNTLKVRDSSRNRRFSVGTNPAKNMLIPSLTENGRVTTPYAPGFPYRQQMKSDR
nr:hypothetical protein RHOSPDRAFT_17883 [Ipomoea batatas]GMD77956.1 hypothetical protein RHOSPDRAFT_17883 [Ipomoea batatas]